MNAAAVPVRDGPVQAELIADVKAVAPGKPFTVAFRMAMDDHWHTYWTNPGDSGLPPSLDWTLPEGFRAGELQHPPPIALPTPPFMTYGHEGDVLFLVTMTPPAKWNEDRITLRAEADWLVCRELCVPGYAALELELPVQPDGPRPDPVAAARIEQARAGLPADPDGWQFHARQTPDRYRLHVLPPEQEPATNPTAAFFPYSARIIRHAAPQDVQSEGRGFVLDLAPLSPGLPGPDRLSGLLVLTRESGRQALRIDIPFSKADPPWLSNPERKAP
ncbi:MAG: hypothetical protein GX548_01540 [Lentisphaerae bacterium]|nr:hypothetical protein [Lentisphaerota bacterium]